METWLLLQPTASKGNTIKPQDNTVNFTKEGGYYKASSQAAPWQPAEGG